VYASCCGWVRQGRKQLLLWLQLQLGVAGTIQQPWVALDLHLGGRRHQMSGEFCLWCCCCWAHESTAGCIECRGTGIWQCLCLDLKPCLLLLLLLGLLLLYWLRACKLQLDLLLLLLLLLLVVVVSQLQAVHRACNCWRHLQQLVRALAVADELRWLGHCVDQLCLQCTAAICSAAAAATAAGTAAVAAAAAVPASLHMSGGWCAPLSLYKALA
jgi:hypothetical protein